LSAAERVLARVEGTGRDQREWRAGTEQNGTNYYLELWPVPFVNRLTSQTRTPAKSLAEEAVGPGSTRRAGRCILADR